MFIIFGTKSICFLLWSFSQGVKIINLESCAALITLSLDLGKVYFLNIKIRKKIKTGIKYLIKDLMSKISQGK